jgi:hypothetical protein
MKFEKACRELRSPGRGSNIERLPYTTQQLAMRKRLQTR